MLFFLVFVVLVFFLFQSLSFLVSLSLELSLEELSLACSHGEKRESYVEHTVLIATCRQDLFQESVKSRRHLRYNHSALGHIGSLNGIECTVCSLTKLPFRHPGQAVGLEMSRHRRTLGATVSNARCRVSRKQGRSVLELVTLSSTLRSKPFSSLTDPPSLLPTNRNRYA